MRLALSVRIAEAARRKDAIALPFEELARLAAFAGFQALSLRASVVSVDSLPERIAAVREALDRQGLAVSMVTGDVPLAANDGDATRAIHQITPYLDLAQAVGAGLLRVMLHAEADIAPARRAADEAAERGLTLAHQTHWGTLFETVEEALATLAAVGRENFAVTYEPANLLACGGLWDGEAIRRLAPHIANVYFQNLRLDASSPVRFATRRRGPVGVRYLPLGDPAGIDPAPLVQALREIGYQGWFTVHQPLLQGQTVEQAIAEAARVFKPLLEA